MEFLRTLRNRSGLSLIEAGEKTGISWNYINDLESKRARNPGAIVIYKLSLLYGITVEEIMIGSGFVQNVDIKPTKMEPSLEYRVNILENKIEKLASVLK